MGAACVNMVIPKVQGGSWISNMTLTQSQVREGVQKKTFLLERSPNYVYPSTHPRVFVRFGKTKGEIWVEKGDFRGDLGGF